MSALGVWGAVCLKTRIFNFTMWDNYINTGGDILYAGGDILGHC